jgi:hypothetical protein
MTGRLLLVCSLVLVLALPGLARAGELRLSIQNGRVSLSARDVTLRQILLEWERVGGTRIVNRDRVRGTLLTLDLVDVPEGQALETLLRSTAGYVAAKRLDPDSGVSQFSRVIIMPGEAAFAPAAPVGASQASGPSGTGGGQPGRVTQRRVLPDGRVVTIMDDAPQPPDPDDAEDNPPPQGGSAGMMRPPFQGAPRLPMGQPGGDPNEDDPPGSQPSRPMSAAPVVPPTVAVPGAVAPAVKPGSATPPGPPKLPIR